MAKLPVALADNLTVQGSTTFTTRLMVPYQAAIEATSGHTLTVIPNKSVNGLIALLEGRTDLAMISAPLESEIVVLRSINPKLSFEKLKVFEISRVRVAFAVHPSNPVRSASLDVIRKIMLGEIDNWRELGGPNLQIRPVIVREGGGVTVTVQAQLLDGQPAAPSVIRVQTPNQVLKVVEQEPGALGVSQLMLVRKHKFPELSTDKPIEQQLSLITLGSPSSSIQSVIDAARTIANRDIK
jgi:phosphate transport system substrate-binding protein